MLGLTSSADLQSFWSKNSRRRIFYYYPNGTAPLTGFLSMMDPHETPIQEFGWFEKRWLAIQTTLASATAPTANSAFYTGGGTVAKADPFAVLAGDSIRVYLTSIQDFNYNNVIFISSLTLTAAVGGVNLVDNLTGVITGMGNLNGPGGNSPANNWIEFTANAPMLGAGTIINGAAANLANAVYVMGSSYAEGTRTDSGRVLFPFEIKNYTQIHKTRFDLTRNALAQPLVYDKSGEYKDALKTNGIDHLTGIEMTLYWGDRTKNQVMVKGKPALRYTSGGLLWFLKQWELGSTAAGGAFDYGQPNVSGVLDWIGNTNKRIIRLGGATVTKSQWNELNSRVFEKTNSSDWCKLCLCGPGYLNKMAEFYQKQLTVTSMRDEGFKGFNFEMVKATSNSGTVYYKQHPLFTDPYMRNSAFYIDPGYIRWRPFKGCDTNVKTGIQDRDEDIRADMYITEGAPEFAFPEAHAFVDNLGGITL